MRKEVVELAVILAKYSKRGFAFGHMAEAAIAIGKIARRVDRMNERLCNEPIPEETAERFYAKARQGVAMSLKEADVSDVGFEIQRDPRGFGVRFHFPGKESNNWGGDFGV